MYIMRARDRFQVTNYGLGGLCESHADPHGYLEGMHLPPERQQLVYTGELYPALHLPPE